MKNLFKKSWFVGLVIIGLMLLVFVVNLWIMSVKLAPPYELDSFLSLSDNLRFGGYLNTFAFYLMLAFYISIAPILLSGLSFFKKNSWGFVVAILYFLGFETTLIVFQSLYHSLSVFALILTILNIIFIIGIFVLLLIRNKGLEQAKGLEKSERDIALSHTKIPLYVLLIDIVSILVFLTTFLIPLYAVIEPDATYQAIILHVLMTGDTHLAVMIYFLANFTILLAMLIYFANSLSHYFFDQEKFVNQSKTLVNFVFIATLAFFLTGLSMNIYYTLVGKTAETIAYVPLFLMLVVMFAYAIFRGKFSSYYQPTSRGFKEKYAKIEPLFYTVLITAVTVLMLFLPIIKIHITAEGYDHTIRLTGFAILKDYVQLDPGYRIVAYILVVMLISVGLGLVIALSSYLSKYKQFNSVVKSVAAVNVFFVFVVAISGYYFQIAKQINQAILLDITDFYGVGLPDGLEFNYSIGTDAVYALMASVAILIFMFLRKAFEKELTELAPADSLLNNGALPKTDIASATSNEEEYQPFDPCPAFTELDLRVPMFKMDLEERKAAKTKATTLNELVHFVVDYARNSRLHLSYTPENIATFVAGLGASRLSILQGMSGTGKTSLPKIFSEAIYGNCDIVEVESSWKDKNELLGYYNEFSMKYTPKKFTQALYKAALNQDICTFILLDEMNLSRIEYYFSDFLSLMENEEDQREIKLVNIKLSRKEDDEDVDYLALENGNTLKVPANVWFIGTANRDESTFVISDKVYDRAHTMNFTKRAPKVRNFSTPMERQYYDYHTMNALFEQAKQNGDFDAENSELIKQVEILLAPYNISFGNRILKQIEDFVNIYNACFDGKDVENEAIEKILLSKVVAKLEVKTIEDKEALELAFEKLNLNQCLAFVRRLDNE